MHKNALFFEKKKTKKNLENRRSFGGSAPNPPLASGGWRIRLQTPVLLLSSPVTVIFSKTFVALTSLLSKRNKKNLKIAIILYFCHSFLTSNSAQVTLANATGSNFSAS